MSESLKRFDQFRVSHVQSLPFLAEVNGAHHVSALDERITDSDARAVNLDDHVIAFHTFKACL